MTCLQVASGPPYERKIQTSFSILPSIQNSEPDTVEQLDMKTYFLEEIGDLSYM